MFLLSDDFNFGDGGSINNTSYNDTYDDRIIYIVLATGRNFTVILKACKNKKDADDFLIYHNRNSIDRAFIEKVILE